ncbi:MAG: protein kinase [Thermomonas sp.]
MSDAAGERRRRALAIFDEIADLPAAEREARLLECCAGDDALQAQVRALLAADATDSEPFRGNANSWGEALANDGGDAQDRMLGRNVGAWKIVGIVGRGGMGAVYAVERSDGAYAQRAALKLIRASADSAASRERFLRERQILAQLQHPNIATLLDGGISAEGEPYFVMELVDGVPIDRWCDERGLGLRERILLFLQALDAVRFAHRNLVVHRDLKPSNLLVDADGRVKLLDFGIAKQLVDADATATMDRALTFAYASPEQLHDAPITTASDIWQLGVILHRLLSGTHPFGLDHGTPVAKQLQRLEREPEPLMRSAAQASAEQAARRGGLTPESLSRALRGNLAEIVHTCLRRDPEVRYASADALANDLRAWLDNRPIAAVRQSRGERTRLWLRRNRVLAASVAAVSLALLAGTGVALWQAYAARTQARIAQRENANATAAMRFITDTFAATSPEQSLKSDVSVLQLVGHAQAELDKNAAVDPKVRQPMQRMLGRLYFTLDDDKHAAELLSAGTRGVQPHSRAEALALADDLVVESIAFDALERFPETLAASDRAAALRKQFAPDDPEQQLRSLANITLAHVQKFGLPACRKQADAALALAKRMPNPPTDVVLHLYSLIGAGARIADDRARMLQASEEGIAFADRHGIAPESPMRMELMRNRAEALYQLGQYPQAEVAVRQAITASEKTGSGGDTRIGIFYGILAKALSGQGRYREAMSAHKDGTRLMPLADLGPRNKSVSLGNEAMLLYAEGDYAKGLAASTSAVETLDKAYIAPGDEFRTPVEVKHARLLLANGRTAEAKSLLDALLPRVRDAEGVDSESYALVVETMAEVALRAGNAADGQKFLDEARARYAKRGLPPTHVKFAQYLREDAALARLRGDLAAAEAKQREAVTKLQSAGNRFDVAAARAELAAIRYERGDKTEARTLLVLALPVMRDSVLPQQKDRAAAESLAKTLGLR